MRVKALCDECKCVIENDYFYRKNRLDEHFCSTECLEKYVLDNIEVRRGSLEEDEAEEVD